MDRPMSEAGFKLMGLMFKVRDLVRPRLEILKEAGIEPGYQVLDYGCGPGKFSVMIAKRTGLSGVVYALDVHPLAIKMVEGKARKLSLTNIKTILSGCSTNLPDGSLDLVILFDVLHALDNQGDVLKELHRLLKSDGEMYFSDHHLKEEQILRLVTEDGLFKLRSKGKMTYLYTRL